MSSDEFQSVILLRGCVTNQLKRHSFVGSIQKVALIFLFALEWIVFYVPVELFDTCLHEPKTSSHTLVFFTSVV